GTRGVARSPLHRPPRVPQRAGHRLVALRGRAAARTHSPRIARGAAAVRAAKTPRADRVAGLMELDATTAVRHVLVADDEPHIGRIIKMKLEQGPFRVTLVYDGQQAIDMLDSDADIDIVLLDLMMPYRSGLDVLQPVPGLARLPN